MEVELGKALSSYVHDVFCSHIYSPSNYNGLHSCTFDYRSELAFYLNVFSGEATLDFRSALPTAQGGILADAMGLRKTVMTISLILANPGRGGMDLPKVAIPSQEDPNSLSGLQLCLQEESSIQSTNQIKDSKRSRSSARHGGGTHIVCRMSLLGQWKVRFQTSHQSLSFTCIPGASCGP
ncbi:unnamed protein product [Sphagnum troendelagicum]|uniref:SNF2 N-terminal domain-containing protein n=1 Tax=Sphagnum troendelagicum TaxID=128251 RepID=A0ABP0TQG2_9BRYO